MRFMWDDKKARANLAKHRVSFEEASTAFYDPLTVSGVNPDYPNGEARWIMYGLSMKKAKPRRAEEMRPEYRRSDFPGGLIRGKYATRVAAGSNIVVLAPDIAAAFPTSEAVNAALGVVLQAAKTMHRKPSSSGRAKPRR